MFKYIWLGLKNLPGYGPHPGTGLVIFLVVIAFIVGIGSGTHPDFLVGLICSSVSLLFWGSLYLYGAYERSKSYSETLEKKHAA